MKPSVNPGLTNSHRSALGPTRCTTGLQTQKCKPELEPSIKPGVSKLTSLSSGSNALYHRFRHCFPLRPRTRPMRAHPTLPFSFTNDRSKASSLCVEERERFVAETVAERMQNRRADLPTLLKRQARCLHRPPRRTKKWHRHEEIGRRLFRSRMYPPASPCKEPGNFLRKSRTIGPLYILGR